MSENESLIGRLVNRIKGGPKLEPQFEPFAKRMLEAKTHEEKVAIYDEAFQMWQDNLLTRFRQTPLPLLISQVLPDAVQTVEKTMEIMNNEPTSFNIEQFQNSQRYLAIAQAAIREAQDPIDHSQQGSL